ncbi:MAG: GcrA family cell cycle regulator [Candidatus Fonsibacter sp.]|jgi:GcrA cell cycle regulator
MVWTPEKTEQLKKLWNEGHTASQIAGMLGDGITRNAVIGKSHRLGLASRANSRNICIQRNEPKFHHRNSIPLKKLRKPRGLRAIVIEKDFEPENPTSLENLSDKTCRWPINHPNEENFYFCGRTPMQERVYCKLHVLHAYQPRGARAEEEDNKTKVNEELPSFIEKKLKTA